MRVTFVIFIRHLCFYGFLLCLYFASLPKSIVNHKNCFHTHCLSAWSRWSEWYRQHMKSHGNKEEIDKKKIIFVEYTHCVNLIVSSNNSVAMFVFNNKWSIQNAFKRIDSFEIFWEREKKMRILKLPIQYCTIIYVKFYWYFLSCFDNISICCAIQFILSVFIQSLHWNWNR